jgi:peptidoglycan/xylan/chitin deacetylase (PgdA/CDA1 family)
MFLKRSLVAMAGILIFIGVFILRSHLSDAHLENLFKKERVKYGVQDTVLTLPIAAPPILHAPAPVAPASTVPAPAPADNETPPPGNATDTNVIIGPVPPTAAPETNAPDNAIPLPTPETNGGPMNPSSTMNNPRPIFRTAFSFLAEAVIGQSIDSSSSKEPSPPNAEETNTPSTNETTPAASSTNATATNATEAASNAPSTNEPPAATNASQPVSSPATNAPGTITHAASAGGRAIVLGYHQFTGPGVGSKNIYSMSQDVFESEMKYLHDNNYNVVPLSDVVAFVEQKKKLPPNAVAITIDDGYKSALVYAAPVLKKYGYPWTYFVYPQFITKTEGKGAASWPDLLELDKEGVDVECHSMTHPQLSRHRQLFTETPGDPSSIKYGRAYHQLSDQEYDDFLTNETFGAKAELEQQLGKKLKYFAYPYGDYNKQVEAKVLAAGFEAIFTVADNPVHITTDVHSIGRYIITKPVERAFAAYLRQGALGLAEVNPEPGATTANPRPVITAVLGFDGDPASLETEVRDFGVVRHDFDPQTSTVRLYLPRDLIQPDVVVSIRAKDAQSGQTMVANWHFNYESAGAAPVTHEPISASPAAEARSAGEFATETNRAATNRAPAETNQTSAPATTNAPLRAADSTHKPTSTD